jgi:hypothetical protein
MIFSENRFPLFGIMLQRLVAGAHKSLPNGTDVPFCGRKRLLLAPQAIQPWI